MHDLGHHIGLYYQLQERGILNDTSFEKSQQVFDRSVFDRDNGNAFYIGFDPTAYSLHVGHVVQLVSMLLFAAAGLKPIVLVWCFFFLVILRLGGRLDVLVIRVGRRRNGCWLRRQGLKKMLKDWRFFLRGC